MNFDCNFPISYFFNMNFLKSKFIFLFVSSLVLTSCGMDEGHEIDNSKGPHVDIFNEKLESRWQRCTNHLGTYPQKSSQIFFDIKHSGIEVFAHYFTNINCQGEYSTYNLAHFSFDDFKVSYLSLIHISEPTRPY